MLCIIIARNNFVDFLTKKLLSQKNWFYLRAKVVKPKAYIRDNYKQELFYPDINRRHPCCFLKASFKSSPRLITRLFCRLQPTLWSSMNTFLRNITCIWFNLQEVAGIIQHRQTVVLTQTAVSWIILPWPRTRAPASKHQYLLWRELSLRKDLRKRAVWHQTV